ncbi:MAG: hypothetical protein JEZ03_15490 [Bacteroidales bacterium]|nr:hypothetical protein [Bacteroidales bacterium]
MSIMNDEIKKIKKALEPSLGKIIVSNWNGIVCVRSKPKHVVQPHSPKQLKHRSRFTMIIAFLKPMVSFIQIGFKACAQNMTAFNAAVKFNFAEAINPDNTIDYSKLRLAKGHLPGVVNGTVRLNNASKIGLYWDDNSDGKFAFGNDKAMVLVYNQNKQTVVFNIDAAQRKDCSLVYNLPTDWNGDRVHSYLCFSIYDAKLAVEDAEAISDSAYLGTVIVE